MQVYSPALQGLKARKKRETKEKIRFVVSEILAGIGFVGCIVVALALCSVLQ